MSFFKPKDYTDYFTRSLLGLFAWIFTATPAIVMLSVHTVHSIWGAVGLNITVALVSWFGAVALGLWLWGKHMDRVVDRLIRGKCY